jgi:hypothetical protein
MEQPALKNVNNCLNTNIYSYLETCGGKIFSLYLNIVHFLNTSVNQTFVASEDNCFPTLISNMCCSIPVRNFSGYSKLSVLAMVTTQS